MTLQLLHSEFPYTYIYEENVILFFISGGAQEGWLEMGCPLGPPMGTLGSIGLRHKNEGENYYLELCCHYCCLDPLNDY
jgi:hypothetical protein